MSIQSQGEVLVRVENVSKKFCRDFKKSLWYGVKDMASELNPFNHRQSTDLQSNDLRPGEFWANKDVTFELRRGECIGLIGHNGAGKTTLLKMLNGLIKPDTGKIEMRGRVGALIALGAGFNPILTGRENIYVNGSVLGLSTEEIDEKLDDIIDFAEIAEFIDVPVQSYSSGMQVRLGFAVATSLNPDVLILDEVLAVGDASFRHKCYTRINKIIKNCAVILVSHSMDHIGACASSVGLMSKGSFASFPNSVDGINAYNNAMLDDNNSGQADGGKVFAIYPPFEKASVEILTPEVEYGQTLEVQVSIDASEAIEELAFSFVAVNQHEQHVMAWNLSRRKSPVRLEAGKSLFCFKIDPLLLHDGKYRWNLWIGRKGSVEACLYAVRAGSFVVTSSFRPVSDIPYVPEPNQFEVTTRIDSKAQS